MTQAEAAALLFKAKWVMVDMGMTIEAGEAEDCEHKLRRGLTREEVVQVADYVLPRGRRGRIKLVLLPPRCARATAFVAAVVRATLG